ncbi:MAG TPA: hypothetical protein VF275_03595 [Gammaproteobacteria bacterium]
MNTQSLNSFIAIPISVDLYAEISRRFPRGASSTLEQVLWDFLERTEADNIPPSEGIYWDSLFLPSGTQVRTKYFDEYKVAKVQEKSIVWKGRSFRSMSQLAHAMRGGTSNNAWKVLEVQFPREKSWQLADYLRMPRR